MGEPQLVFNYVRAFADYINNFTFGKGIGFRTPKYTEAIIPHLLKRVWEEDNPRDKLLWEIGQVGGVSGDVFVKIAYEDSYADSIGMIHPGRVRIIPINPAFCLTEDTEILTRRGWLTLDEVQVGDQTLGLDPETDELSWTDVERVNIFDWDGPLSLWENERFSAASTPDHRWVFDTKRGHRCIRTTGELDATNSSGSLVLAGGTPVYFPTEAKWTDELVETIGWFVTEGCYRPDGRIWITQSSKHTPHVATLRRLGAHWGGAREYGPYKDKSVIQFSWPIAEMLRGIVGNDKQVTPEFLTQLTYQQATLLYNTLLEGDGNRQKGTQNDKGVYFYQKDLGRVDAFQMLAAMLGQRSSAAHDGDGQWTVTAYQSRGLTENSIRKSQEHYTGRVWCPTTTTGTWYARRQVSMPNGGTRQVCYTTGNCFPEFAPHDRTRLLRFKMKYRFWGCVDTKTEALTKRGWMRHDELTTDDEILTLDPDTDAIRWQPVEAVNVYNDYAGHMVAWDQVGAVSSPNHRWLVEQQRGRLHTTRYERRIARTEFAIDGDPAVPALRNGCRVIVGGGTPLAFSEVPKWSDEAVETLAWYITEGWDHTNQTGARSIYLAQKKPEMVARIRRLQAAWRDAGATFSEYAPRRDGVITWYFGKGVKEAMWEMAPGKAITPEFLTSLTYQQAVLFYNTLLDGDGCRTNGTKNTIRWTQKDEGRKDGFQMLCAMLGKRTAKTSCGEKVQEYAKRFVLVDAIKHDARRVYLDDGTVWCPTVQTGIWFARREGKTFWTGNTSLEGQRQVYTYVEISTDEAIEEYINDELIQSIPNAMGRIPFVHIPNFPVSGSPWGLSDIADLIPLNREYNEKATEISDIVNYYSAPVTVITGARATNLERGPKKVWAIPSKDANIQNLTMADALTGPLNYLNQVKRSMHELVGVPELALGEEQPISNTSGVALSIQYQPLVNRYNLKKIQYTQGFKQINALIILMLALKEPQSLQWDPSEAEEPRPDEDSVLNPLDPGIYETSIHWPSPLPIDMLIKLNEVQVKMSMGLMSKRGALRELGEEFPDEVLAEVFTELTEDAFSQGALDLIKGEIQQTIMSMTGLLPDGTPVAAMGPQVSSPGGPDVNTASQGAGPAPAESILPGLPDEPAIVNKLLTLAHGTKLAQRRNPGGDSGQGDVQ